MYFYLLAIPSIMLFYMVFLNICKCKFYIHEVIISFLMTSILAIGSMFIVLYFVPVIGIDIPGNLIIASSLFLLLYIKTKDILLSCYYALLTTIITMVGGGAIGSLISIILNIYLYEDRENFLLYSITMVPAFPVCYFLARYLSNRIHQCYDQLSYEIKRDFLRYGCILSSLTYVLSHFNLFANKIVEDPILFSSINVIIISVVFFVAMTMTIAYSFSQQRQMEVEIQSKAQKDLEIHTKNLKIAYDEMRCFKHDHLNMLYGLVGYIDSNTPEGLQKYLKQNLIIAEESLGNLDKNMAHLRFICIPELRGLLSVKLAQAQSRGIELELDLAKPLDKIDIERPELCRMVGIIVDNAIEELSFENYDKKVLSFGIIIEKTEVLIICSNTCKTAPPIEYIFSKGYTTKGLGRGEGLYNLKESSKKCGNVLVSAYAEEGIFTIIITILERRLEGEV